MLIRLRRFSSIRAISPRTNQPIFWECYLLIGGFISAVHRFFYLAPFRPIRRVFVVIPGKSMTARAVRDKEITVRIRRF